MAGDIAEQDEEDFARALLETEICDVCGEQEGEHDEKCPHGAVEETWPEDEEEQIDLAELAMEGD